MSADLLLTIAGGFVAVAAAVEAIRRLIVSPLRRIAREWQEFWSDWKGEPAREGVKERPGVMKRLDRMEWQVGNGSSVSLRTVVDRTARDLHTHIGRAVDVPLRTVVERTADDLQDVKRTIEEE